MIKITNFFTNVFFTKKNINNILVTILIGFLLRYICKQYADVDVFSDINSIISICYYCFMPTFAKTLTLSNITENIPSLYEIYRFLFYGDKVFYFRANTLNMDSRSIGTNTLHMNTAEGSNSPAPSSAPSSAPLSESELDTIVHFKSLLPPLPPVDYEIRSSKTNFKSYPFLFTDLEGKTAIARIPLKELKKDNYVNIAKFKISLAESKLELTTSFNKLTVEIEDSAFDWCKYELARQYYEYKLGTRPDLTNNVTKCKDYVVSDYLSRNGNPADLSDNNKMIDHINSRVEKLEDNFKINKHLQSSILDRMHERKISFKPVSSSDYSKSKLLSLVEKSSEKSSEGVKKPYLSIIIDKK